MSMVDGSNTIPNSGIVLLSDTASYDGTKRSSVDDDYTEYSIANNWNFQATGLRISVDFEVYAIDETNTIWFVSDRNALFAGQDTGRFQLSYDNNNNEFLLIIFTQKDNQRIFHIPHSLPLNTRTTIDVSYYNYAGYCTAKINGVNETNNITTTDIGVFQGIRDGTSGNMVIGGRGWNPSKTLASLIGEIYQLEIKRV